MRPRSTTRALSPGLFWGPILVLLMATTARAERLAINTYTTANGLLRDTAYCIVQDSRGFLWFCTSDGLSRFDGYGFTNYTTDDGLPHRTVNAFLEMRSGAYWAATNDGLARFNPMGRRDPSSGKDRMFITYRPENNQGGHTVNVLLEDHQGRLWCGTDDGLYWFEEGDGKGIFHRVDLPKVNPNAGTAILTLGEDPRGKLWIGSAFQGLFSLAPDGRIERHTGEKRLPEAGITSTLVDVDGNLWVGTSSNGLCQLVADRITTRFTVSQCYTTRDGLASDWIRHIYQASDGRLWVSTTGGAAVAGRQPEPGERRFRMYKEAQGFCDGEAWGTREDRDGNIWVATSCGIKKVAHGGFVRFTQQDGLSSLFVSGIVISHRGELFTITKRAGESSQKPSRDVHSLNQFNDDHFTFATPQVPPGVGTGWGGGQIGLQDRAGNWWLPGDQYAVYRFPKTTDLTQLARLRPQVISIPDREAFRLYEDSRGDVWISTMPGGSLLRWERATETIRYHRHQIGSPGIVTAFAENRAGVLWMGFDYGEAKLARYHDGAFRVIASDSTRATGGIVHLLFDHAGRLWLATKAHGVGRIDDPDAARLQIAWYTRKKGMATDGTAWLLEDTFGRIYVAHGRGVDRIDPNSGQIRHYTSADGLPQGAIHFGARAADGALWFGSYGGGLARLLPEPDQPRQVPTILLTGLRVAGVARAVSGVGESSVPAIRLRPDETHVSIDFLGLGASLGEELKYQYRLEGSTADWVDTTQRTVEFANLSPGSYRFMVRAVAFDDLVSRTAATVSFTIAAPVWQRWWFMALASALVGSAAFALYRYRVSRLLEIERVRTRIAADLHDDIGASLSRVAIMREVLKRQVPGSASVPMLTEIADSARELVRSMRDIVWAIDPRRDDVDDVVSRIRTFASDMLEAHEIKWSFHTPSELGNIKLGADAKRHIVLFFKEAINNVVRHSKASEVRLDIQVAQNRLIGEVRDDGRGFAPVPEVIAGGQGLASMQRRVGHLRGTLAIDSSPGQGTHVRLMIPLKKS